MNSIYLSLLGGSLIGFAVSLMLYLNGRVTGVSGIVNGALKKSSGDFLWRVLFIAGLLIGGLLLKIFYPVAFGFQASRSLVIIAIAGLLVGFGTVLGGGCTSGHGICGISRFSIRSLIATIAFMAAGILSATLFRLYFAGLL